MNKRETINKILVVLAEEAKKIKKKKSLVATPILRRPMGSFSILSVSEELNEASRSIIKPITKKFDNLKWKLNDYQKQLLDDFISVPDEQLRESDYEYISKRTDIPAASIKSIKNTYADKRSSEEIYKEQIKIQRELGMGSGDETMAKMIEKDALEQISAVRDLPKSNSGKAWSMNPQPEFRAKSLHQISYDNDLSAHGGFDKTRERKLPSFMYEWVMYFVEGSEKIKIKESKLMNDLHSDKFGEYTFVMFSIDTVIKESGAHPYDIGSNTKVKDVQELMELIKEFNDTFGTNFIISNQYTGDDGFLKIVLENAQYTDGKKVINKKQIDMTDNDIVKSLKLGFYDQFTTTRSIT